MATILTFAEQRDGKLRRASLEVVSEARRLVGGLGATVATVLIGPGTESLAGERPEKVLGLHFFSPVQMMEVVEVIKGVKTSEETMQAGVDFVRKIGKEPIRVERDVPGFLLNRINLVRYVEAIRLLEQGIGTIEDIDKGVRLAFGRRMGPLETGDLVGLDVSYGALTAIYEKERDVRYEPPPLLKRKVKAGELGRKTGRGWYEYQADGNRKEK